MEELIHPRLRLRYFSSLTSIREVNKSFDVGRMLIAYPGKNRNGSDITKEAFEKALSTIYNCPVVCNYDAQSDTIGGHDSAVIHTDDGGIRLVNMTVPVGVVPESSEIGWEKVTEQDGTEREYLAADVLLWKRQDAYRKIKEDGICGQSMEITVKSGQVNKDDKSYRVDDFEFNAFCLLGDDVEPCFESAALEMYSCDNFSTQMAQMMQDFKESFAYIHSANTGEDIKSNDSYEEGGNDLDKKIPHDVIIRLAEEYGLNVEELDCSAYEDMDVVELKEKFEAMKPADEEEQKEFRLEGEARSELIKALESETVETPYGDMPRYWFFDYDNELMEIYATDSDDWNIYGFHFSADGDAFVIDFESKKRMRIALVEFDEGEQKSPFAEAYEMMSAAHSNLTKKYNVVSESLQAQDGELIELRKYKQNVEEEADKAKRESVFAKFANLDGIEEFDALKSDCSEMKVEELEEKCFAILGRNSAAAKFSYEPKSAKIKVQKEDCVDEPYGGLFQRYGRTAN